MTLKEAKKILKKEGFIVDKIGKPRTVFDFFIENEAPDICEAMQVVSTAGYDIYMEANRFEERKERLKKEYEENNKDQYSAENHIKEDSGVNTALSESASQFNDALLDEQAKKIVELTDENERLKDQVAVLYECKENNEKYNLKQIKRLGKEITRLNKAIHKKNMKIEELRKESSRHLRGKIKVFYENVDLEKMLKDKDAILSDVAEELRLSKIREKNLTEVCQKYMKENEELMEKLDKKIVDKIDAQALKSSESALAYKEKVIAEKDEVIANLGKELKEKHKKYVWYKGAYEAAQHILNTIADYAAKHPDKKFSDQMVVVDIAEEGADHSGATVLCGKDFVKKFKENGWFDFFEKNYKEKAEELSKVADEAFEQLLLFGEVIIKSEK